MKGSTAMWNYDAVDKKEAERMASLYGEDATRTVEHGTEAETGELLVRSCGNELGFATWEAFDFERNTWLCEAFENREAAELWLSGGGGYLLLAGRSARTVHQTHGRTRRQHVRRTMDRRNP